MSKAGLLTLVGIVSLAAILTAGFPLSRVKADHCHPTQNQTRAVTPQPQNTGPRAPVRSRMSAIQSPRSTRAQSSPANSSIKAVGTATASIEQLYSRDLPLAIQSIEHAVKAIESGDRQTELAELTKAVTLLAAIHESLGKHIKPQLANSRCPIMGSIINPDSVAMNLTRDYKGQKIGFCCAGCPSAWDKLTDTQKQAKLSGVKS